MSTSSSDNVSFWGKLRIHNVYLPTLQDHMLINYRVKDVDPDCTKARFNEILRSSPAASAANAVYDYCLQKRVSPLFILGMFWHESKFGTVGWATKTKSWGNTRLPSYGAMNVGAYNQDTGTFYKATQERPPGRYLAAYNDWVAGGISTVARLLEHLPYADKQHVKDILYTWAPPLDSNNTELYVSVVLRTIEMYYDVGFPGIILPAGNVRIGDIDFGGEAWKATRVTVDVVNTEGTRYQRIWRIDSMQPWTEEE